MTTDLSICQSALLLVGDEAIESFTDSSRAARICSKLYTVTKQKRLQSHNWNFSLAFQELAKIELTDGTPEEEFGYDYAYQLPPDYLRFISKNEPSNDYQIVGDKLYTSDDDVQILYQYDVSESEFPAYFTRVLELDMASLLAGALIQDESLMQIMAAMRTEELISAKNIDSQNNPSTEIDESNFALTSVR